jgi:hypothetical protein
VNDINAKIEEYILFVGARGIDDLPTSGLSITRKAFSLPVGYQRGTAFQPFSASRDNYHIQS